MGSDLENRYAPDPPVKVEPDGAWARLRPLEKVGVVSLGAVAVGVIGAVLAPGFAATTVGGALVGAGGWLIRKGVRG